MLLSWLMRRASKRSDAKQWLSRVLGHLFLPEMQRRLLLNLIELDGSTVNDIMIPRQAVMGIDLDADPKAIMQALKNTVHTRMPVFRGDLNHTVGILHVRNVARLLGQEQIAVEDILRYTRSPYFLPERTPLPAQLIAFQKAKRRLGLVVNEYGDIQGIVTLESILEQLVGEFTTHERQRDSDIMAADDGSHVVHGSISLRAINRALSWTLPVQSARTLNGLLLSELEGIPEGPACLRIGHYCIEVLSLRGHLVDRARVWALTD